MKKFFQFPEVRVVEASAGSGKTFALAKRYVQLALDPRASSHDLPIRTILAITFMKKASFEMKQRILIFLKGIALKTMKPGEAQEVVGPIGLDAETASKRAFEVMDDLIHHYNFFQVQTIDSFINALLSGCAFKIGLSSHFRIKHNPFDYLSYSLDRLIEHAVHEPKIRELFTQFLDQYLLLENKASWFPKKDILGLLNALYHQRNSYGMEFALHASEDSIIAQMAHLMSLMRKLQENFPAEVHATFVKSLNNFLGRYTTAFDFDRLSDSFQRDEIPVRKGAEVSPQVQDLWEEIRSAITRLAESEAYLLFSPYVAVFRELLKEFQVKTAKDDVLFMEELNRKARLLFDEGGVTVEELYYRMATRFRHYMIDEFQDTSVLQWENLMMMVDEALSTGGSLFYVGDKKQAIYGFRGGEAALFDQLKEQFQHFHVRVELLKKNYRSYEAIVQFNNRVFDLKNLERFIAAREEMESAKKGARKNGFAFNDDDHERLKRTFEECAQEARDDRKGGYVRVEYIPGAKRQERDEMTRERLVDVVKDLHRRFDWKDIAILTRKNFEVEQVTAWLMEEGVPVKSERTLNITENSVVQEMVAFLRFLNSPIDHLSFAQVILGDVFSKATGLKTEEMHAFLFELRKNRDKQKDPALYREFRKAYPQVWDKHITPFFRSTGFYPLYELFISILQEWQVLKHFEDQCGFVMQLLEVIKRREEEGCDLISFLEYFDKIRNEDAFVNVAELDSVEILTTHKSKGLEFKVVVLPFAAMEIQVGTRGGGPGEELGQRSYILNTQSEQMELLRIKTDYLPYSDHLYQIYRAQAVEALFSELNNAYVSLTRAEQEMYIFVPEKAGNSTNLMTLLLPEGFGEIGTPGAEKEAGPEDREPSPEVSMLPAPQYRDWISYLNEEFMTERDALVNRERIKRGKELHELLALVRTTECGERKAEMSGTIRHPSSVLRSPESEEKIKEILKKEELKFLFETDGEVFTEKEIVDAQGHTKRIDRLIVKDDEVIVVDYKLTRIKDKGLRSNKNDDPSFIPHPSSLQYQEQVKGYMDILRQLYPEKDIRGCLLYLDSLELEEIKGTKTLDTRTPGSS